MGPEYAEMFSRLVAERRSVRAFLASEVPPEVLHRVFTDAQRAPSNCNTQPWKVVVVSGDIRRRVCERMMDGMLNGRFDMDFEYNGTYSGVYKERQHDSARQLLEVAQGIERADKARRNEAFMRNFDGFGAPHIAFLFLPEPFGLREAADLGMYAQTLMLALTANGLGSVPQTALSFQASEVRELLGLPASDKLLFGISFGYEDRSHPANACRVARANVADVVSFRA